MFYVIKKGRVIKKISFPKQLMLDVDFTSQYSMRLGYVAPLEKVEVFMLSFPYSSDRKEVIRVL